jgi:prolipoprotein diacylglyceryl transferase
MTGSVTASIPAPNWSGFDIPLPWGVLRIHAYALCILAGIIAAVWLTYVRWNRRGGPEGSIWDIAIWAIPAGIIGGRLYHVFSSPDAYFGPGFNGHGDLSLIPQIWRGGLGIWGAVLLGVVGAWIGCRRAGVKLSAFVDAAAPGILLAQALGRWGNYFNQELFGGPTTLPWGLQVDASNPNFPAGFAAGTLFHPTFLYESIWDLLGVAVLLLLDRRFRFRRSRLFWLYAMIYTLGRFWIELLRIDAAEQITFFGITTRLNVWTSILVFIVSLLAFVLLGLRKRSADDGVMLAGRGGPGTADGDGTGAEGTAAAEGATGKETAAADRTTGDTTTGDRAAADAPAVSGTDAGDADRTGRTDHADPAAQHPDSAVQHPDKTGATVSDSGTRDNLADIQHGSSEPAGGRSTDEGR